MNCLIQYKQKLRKGGENASTISPISSLTYSSRFPFRQQVIDQNHALHFLQFLQILLQFLFPPNSSSGGVAPSSGSGGGGERDNTAKFRWTTNSTISSSSLKHSF